MTRTISRLFLMCALSLGITAPVLAQSATPKPGQYEAMLLAVTPDGQIEGYYSEVLGVGVTQHCAFYFNGQGGDAINTWNNEVYPGYIVASDQGVIMASEHGRDHPACAGLLPPEFSDGIEFGLIELKPWIGLVTVSSDKAYLLKTPGGKSDKRPYIVKEDVVAVLAYKDGWANVEFINSDGRSFTGWIQQDQYVHLKAPEPNGAG